MGDINFTSSKPPDSNPSLTRTLRYCRHRPRKMLRCIILGVYMVRWVTEDVFCSPLRLFSSLNSLFHAFSFTRLFLRTSILVHGLHLYMHIGPSILVHAFALSAVLPRAHIRASSDSKYACIENYYVSHFRMLCILSREYPDLRVSFFRFSKLLSIIPPAHIRSLLADGLRPRVHRRRTIWVF